MQRATVAEEGPAVDEDGTATDAVDQEEAMMRNEADSGCGAVIQEEVAAPVDSFEASVASKGPDPWTMSNSSPWSTAGVAPDYCRGREDDKSRSRDRKQARKEEHGGSSSAGGMTAVSMQRL